MKLPLGYSPISSSFCEKTEENHTIVAKLHTGADELGSVDQIQNSGCSKCVTIS